MLKIKRSTIRRFWRRNPIRQLFHWFDKVTPKGLYSRSLIIIIAPMVLLQSVIAYVFMERHWQTVTERLSKAVTADIAAIIETIDTYPQDNEFEQITRIAREKLDLNISILPPDPLPPPVPKPFFSLLDDILQKEITEQIGRTFWIDTVGDSDLLEIRIPLEKHDKVLRVFTKRNRAYASNSHIFLMWMFGTSFFLIIIAILFLRNQIRPILKLANAAELYGKGRDLPADFSVRGAREVRQAGVAFLEMRERIDRQIHQRTTMLTGVSHDLRTILTRFQLHVALLGKKADIEELQSDIGEMNQMLEGYLDFAKGQAGEDIETVDVYKLLKRYETDARLSKLKFDLKLPSKNNNKLTIRARRNAITRLIENLVSNAIRHGDHIRLGANMGETKIAIEIEDNGPGIDEQHYEDVFKPFLRLDEARNIDTGGTGLGLSIARDIARLHGGDIALSKSKLGGLCATATLPL